MTRAIILDTGTARDNLAGALRLRAAISKDLGYPRDGVDVGGGRHVPPERSRTLYAVEVIAHPDGVRAACQVTPEVEDRGVRDVEDLADPEDSESRITVRVDPTLAAELDATWMPPDDADPVR